MNILNIICNCIITLFILASSYIFVKYALYIIIVYIMCNRFFTLLIITGSSRYTVRETRCQHKYGIDLWNKR